MFEMTNQSVFEELFRKNVNGHTETKSNGQTNLTYLSWAWAWAEVKKAHENVSYEIERFNGLPYQYDPMTGYMVWTKVTIDDITHEMWLPVMDGANKAMKAEAYTYQTRAYNRQTGKMENVTKTVQPATMFDINKTIMRCLTKNLAMFGLGLYIYAGEDLPEDVETDVPTEEPKPEAVKKPEPKEIPKPENKASKQDVEILKSLINDGIFNGPELMMYYKVESLEELDGVSAKQLVSAGLRRRNGKPKDQGM